jgi:hypothetical protein
MDSLSRRKLLGGCAAGLLAGLAGCSADAAMFVEPVETATAIGRKATDGSERAPRDSDRAELVAAAVDGGTNRTDSYGPPYQPDRPVVHNDTVYNLTWSEATRDTSRTEYEIGMTVYDDDRATDAEFADLPAVDRERVDPGMVETAVRRVEDTDEEFPVDYGAQFYWPPAEREQSALVPEPQYDTIEIAGQPVELSVEPTTVSLDVYRYTATERAPSVAAFGRDLRREHRFELSGLSKPEREFFDRVRSEGSFYKGSFDDVPDGAFKGLADHFVAEPAIFVENTTGEWLTRYEGTDYWVEIDFVLLEEYEQRLRAVESL